MSLSSCKSYGLYAKSGNSNVMIFPNRSRNRSVLFFCSCVFNLGSFFLFVLVLLLSVVLLRGVNLSLCFWCGSVFSVALSREDDELIHSHSLHFLCILYIFMSKVCLEF